ncbi:MAG: threonine/serine dehydratase [Gammaproteobacteria bacterium]|nr:threonine/serine dehydratase [Pseudomonadota bacterium]TDJ39549.1 MAG: threonine/serine dehydratase [Gammaproteobacteria bacterium]
MPALTVSDVAESSERAAARIAGLVRETPLDYSPAFSAATGADVWFKLENLQHTGSFKLRGAANRLMTLTPEERAAGCVTASSGNHGAAVAYAMQKLNIAGVIFVPEQTSSVKVDAIRSYGGDVRFFGTDGLDTELHARDYAGQNSMFYVSPYNDAEVMAGQGSCGVEIAAQLPDVDEVFIAIGGGGLISGVGSVLRRHSKSVRIIGCQPSASAVMAHSVEAGEILQLPSAPTLSDGTAGGIEPGAITFDLCKELVDDYVLIDEPEIAAAMRTFMDSQHQLIEGAAAVAIAAMLANAADLKGRKVVILVCGANISRESLLSVIS